MLLSLASTICVSCYHCYMLLKDEHYPSPQLFLHSKAKISRVTDRRTYRMTDGQTDAANFRKTRLPVTHSMQPKNVTTWPSFFNCLPKCYFIRRVGLPYAFISAIFLNRELVSDKWNNGQGYAEWTLVTDWQAYRQTPRSSVTIGCRSHALCAA